MYATVNNLSEYLQLMDEAIFELEEMVFCVEEEPDDELVDLGPHCQQIVDYLKNLKVKIQRGEHQFQNKDLDYVPLLYRLKNVLPFYGLLQELNRIQLYSDLKA